jgi:hypothetical protein
LPIILPLSEPYGGQWMCNSVSVGIRDWKTAQ